MGKNRRACRRRGGARDRSRTRPEKLSRKLIADIHAHLFEELFPAVGGRFRRKDEGASYTLRVGTRDRPEERRQTGTGGRGLQQRLQAICEEFNDAAEAAYSRNEPRFMEDLIRPAVKAYCKLLSAHPFIDGNGRTCYLVLQFALVRIGLLTVALTDFEEHQWALGQALRRDGKQSYAQMEQLIADTIRDARAEWETYAEMALKRHKTIIGYDGLTGAYAAVDGRIMPLTDPGAHIALTDAALLASLGTSPKAHEYSEIAEGHGAIRPTR